VNGRRKFLAVLLLVAGCALFEMALAVIAYALGIRPIWLTLPGGCVYGVLGTRAYADVRLGYQMPKPAWRSFP
jgi:hypothetical protein